MKKKKYKIIKNNRHVYAVKECSNKNYYNSKKRMKRR